MSIALQCCRDNWKGQSVSVSETPISRHECLVSAHVSSLFHGKAGMALIMLQLKRRFSIRLWNSAVVLRPAQFVWMRQDGMLTKALAEDTSMVVSLVVVILRCPPYLSTKENLLSSETQRGQAWLPSFHEEVLYFQIQRHSGTREKCHQENERVIWRNYERHEAGILWGKC